MKHKRSIVTEKYAREWRGLMRNDALPAHSVLRVRGADCAVSVRRCSYRDGTLSGGVEIRILAPLYKHECGFGKTFSTPLSSGWSEERFKGAVRGLFWKTRDHAHISERREALYQKFESTGIMPRSSAEFINGHSTVYVDMDHADIDYWFAWIAEQGAPIPEMAGG